MMLDYVEPPWVTEMRAALDKAWAEHLRLERQAKCSHKRMTEREELDAHTFVGVSVLDIPAQCKDCGWIDA